jgi:hypothetical protein
MLFSARAKPRLHTLDACIRYAFLLEFLTEMGEIFPDPVLMLGGDEVGCSCTNSTGGMMESQAFDLDPSSAAWLRAHNMTSANATDYFWKRMAADVIPKLNKTLQIWSVRCALGPPLFA